jgi:hypothetical protein
LGHLEAKQRLGRDWRGQGMHGSIKEERNRAAWKSWVVRRQHGQAGCMVGDIRIQKCWHGHGRIGKQS